MSMNFLDLVKKRYSVRSYLPRAIEADKMNYIMECVRLAPSAVNFQPWHFSIVTDSEKLSKLKSAYLVLSITFGVIVESIPVLEIALSEPFRLFTSWNII